MIDDGRGVYESAQMEPVGQWGIVEEADNTVVDGMGIMDEMMMNDGGDDVDGMGIADGELEMVAEEFALQVAQWNNGHGQVDGVSDQHVQSTHDVGVENEMQEQSVEAGNSKRGFSDLNTDPLNSVTDVVAMEEVEMTRLLGEEGCNVEISDAIAPFGDDDDCSFGRDEEIGYERTEYGSDVEIPEEDFCQMDAGQHSRQFQRGMLHNQDVTDTAGFIATTPDPDTPPPDPVTPPSQTNDIGAASYNTPTSNASPPGCDHRRCTSAPPQICGIQITPIRLPLVALPPFVASRVEEPLNQPQNNHLPATTVLRNPADYEVNNSPSHESAGTDDTQEISCIWDQAGVLERYKELIGDGALSTQRRREVDRWGKEVMSLVKLSRPVITQLVRKMFDGYLRCMRR